MRNIVDLIHWAFPVQGKRITWNLVALSLSGLAIWAAVLILA